MSATVFYFSGTGNSLIAARSIADKLEFARIIPLAGLAETLKTNIDDDVVVFVFPVYAGGPPVLVLKALARLKFVGSPLIYVVATCASFAGAALDIFAKELKKLTSQELAASWVLYMPGNYPPLREAESSSEILNKFSVADNHLKQIAAAIAQKKLCRSQNLFSFVNRLTEIVWRGFASSVAKSDRRFRASNQCVSCGLCATVCPVGNIVLNKSGRPVWQHRCEQCMACLQFCPVEAIQFCWWTKGRRRYHHPQVTPEMIAAQKNQS